MIRIRRLDEEASVVSGVSLFTKKEMDLHRKAENECLAKYELGITGDIFSFWKKKQEIYMKRASKVWRAKEEGKKEARKKRKMSGTASRGRGRPKQDETSLHA